MKLLLASIALALCATPASGNMQLPPKRYDMGHITLEEARAAFPEVTFHRVYHGDAFAKCNEIRMANWGTPYPMEAEAEGPLLGCRLSSMNNTNTHIVISYDLEILWLETFLLRHELGHELGWNENHPNGRPYDEP